MPCSRSTRGILYRIAGSYSRNPADRSDLTQEIVLQLWRSFGRFDGRCRFSTWMYRIAMNVGISFSRSESLRLRRTEPADESTFEIAAPGGTAPETSDGARKLDRFIQDELDPLNRALVILYLDGNSHETIAEILGISATNVGTRIGRIKQRLRQHFDRARHDGKGAVEKEKRSWSSTN